MAQKVFPSPLNRRTDQYRLSPFNILLVVKELQARSKRSKRFRNRGFWRIQNGQIPFWFMGPDHANNRDFRDTLQIAYMMNFGVDKYPDKHQYKRHQKAKKQGHGVIELVIRSDLPPPVSLALSMTITSDTLAAFTRPASERLDKNKS